LGDDTEAEYYAWYGRERYRVVVSVGPAGGLTGLRVTPEMTPETTPEMTAEAVP
jgi:hypothetical protein